MELCCLICDALSAQQAEVKELKQEVAHLKNELRRLGETRVERQENTSTVEKSSGDGFKVVTRGRKASAQSLESANVPLQNRFAPLEEEDIRARCDAD